MPAGSVVQELTSPEVQSAVEAGQKEGYTDSGRFWTTQKTSDNNFQKFFTGAPLLADIQREYNAFLRDQQSAREAREYEERLANTAYQRKMKDLVEAGFSPLAALDASGQGAAVPTAQVAKSSQQESSNPMGQLFGAVLAAIGLIMARGVGTAVSGKNALAVAKLKGNWTEEFPYGNGHIGTKIRQLLG